MPEGHTVHRAARRQHALLAGRVVAAGSPQGRFADGAAALDGRVLERVEAAGKHLFYRFDRGEVLHVHLGLFGRFRYHGGPPPEPRGAVRMRLTGAEGTVDLSGPTACDLIGDDGREAIMARLGPDPLRSDADPERAIDAMARRRLPIGAALLDQSIIAGLGNVYRAEVLFVCAIDPARESRSLARSQLEAIWGESRRMLREGVRLGRIVTVSAAERGTPPSRARRGERTYVYRRSTCFRCGGPVERPLIGARPCYRCPACQR